jgi:hypothetical protein
MPAMSSVGSTHFAHSWPQSSLCQMTSNWSPPEVRVAVTFSWKMSYAIGILISSTSFASAHFSIMATLASWIGCFMYPTLSSVWARLCPDQPTAVMRVSAAHAPPCRRRFDQFIVMSPGF